MMQLAAAIRHEILALRRYWPATPGLFDKIAPQAQIPLLLPLLGDQAFIAEVVCQPDGKTGISLPFHVFYSLQTHRCKTVFFDYQGDRQQMLLAHQFDMKLLKDDDSTSKVSTNTRRARGTYKTMCDGEAYARALLLSFID